VAEAQELFMFFSIDPNNGIAIYEQIVRQVKFAIADGVLVPGQLLPSVRTLAVSLAINPNTIAKAFSQLQNDGVVESLRGRGIAVRSSRTDCEVPSPKLSTVVSTPGRSSGSSLRSLSRSTVRSLRFRHPCQPMGLRPENPKRDVHHGIRR
jgi:DNA-binding transcriptional regulator YhcF (GntR family)